MSTIVLNHYAIETHDRDGNLVGAAIAGTWRDARTAAETLIGDARGAGIDVSSATIERDGAHDSTVVLTNRGYQTRYGGERP